MFIIAHGAYAGDDRNSVIGDESADFYVNAFDLYENILGIFRSSFNGNVYIDACESANHGKGTFSFAEDFKVKIQVDHGNTKIFGRKGEVSGKIPPPGDRDWVQA